MGNLLFEIISDDPQQGIIAQFELSPGGSQTVIFEDEAPDTSISPTDSLSLKILSDLPDNGILKQFEFFAGESRDLRFGIYDVASNASVNIPQVQSDPEAGPVVSYSLVLPSTTGTDMVLTPIQDPVHLSVFSLSLTPTETNFMRSGWIRFEYIVDGALRVAASKTAIRKMVSP